MAIESLDNQIKSQIEKALGNDPKQIGTIFECLQQNHNNLEETAKQLGHKSSGGVRAYQNYIDALYHDYKTDSSIRATQTKRQLRSFLKRHQSNFSGDTIAHIKKAISYYDEISELDKNVQKEEETSIRKLKEFENTDSIYVYSFSHYIKHPHIEYDDGFNDDRYMLKVGRTSSSVISRIKNQTAAMPEEPTIYFVFGLGSSNLTLEQAEKKFHDHLNVIGHRRAKDTGGGKEWFLTNFDTIESIANLMLLEVSYDLSKDDSSSSTEHIV